MTKLLATLLLVLATATSYGDTPPALSTLLRGFVRDAIGDKLSDLELADKYFCTNVLHRTDSYGEQARGQMGLVLSQQRLALRQRQLALGQVVFTAYAALPASQVPAKPFHLLSGTEHVYVAQYHGEIIAFLLLQEQETKLASTLLLDRGGENYFLNFCN